MKKLRIVIGSNDGRTLVNGHFGESKNFHVYDVFDDGSFLPIDIRENTSKNSLNHGSLSKLKTVSSIIKDADVVISKRQSPNLQQMNQNSPFQPIIVESELIENSIKSVLSAFDDVYRLVESKKNGNATDFVPTLESVVDSRA